MKKILILIFVFAIAQTSFSQFNKAGRTAFQFLKIGNGARQVALGEASIACVQDVNSIFWNPAAVTGINGAEVSFNYNSWIGDLKVLSGVAAFNLEGIATFTVNAISLDYGDIPEARVTSVSGSTDTRTGNFFSGSDLAFGLGVARKFTDKLSIGINVKYMREELFIYSSSLWGFDVGSFYDTGWRGIKLAMSAQNFSTQARFLETKEEEQQTYEIPLVYRLGVSIDLLGGEDLFLGGNPDEHIVTFNVDAIHTNDYKERMHLGLEYKFYDMFFLRGGYKLNYDEGKLSFGAGINYALDSFRIKFDYAYVSYDLLQSPHRFTVAIGF